MGGQWIVNGAVIVVSKFGMSQSLGGLTIVAVGTSLPELATSVMAAYKKNVEIAVGNVVGSNIFTVFFALGISATIKPLPFLVVSNLDIGGPGERNIICDHGHRKEKSAGQVGRSRSVIHLCGLYDLPGYSGLVARQRDERAVTTRPGDDVNRWAETMVGGQRPFFQPRP